MDGLDGGWPKRAVRVEMARGGSAEDLWRRRHGHGVREAAEGVTEVRGVWGVLGEVEWGADPARAKLSAVGCSSRLGGRRCGSLGTLGGRKLEDEVAPAPRLGCPQRGGLTAAAKVVLEERRALECEERSSGRCGGMGFSSVLGARGDKGEAASTWDGDRSTTRGGGGWRLAVTSRRAWPCARALAVTAPRCHRATQR
jgi:hypothetical protein